jgi:hypothetical protein
LFFCPESIQAAKIGKDRNKVYTKWQPVGIPRIADFLGEDLICFTFDFKAFLARNRKSNAYFHLTHLKLAALRYFLEVLEFGL